MFRGKGENGFTLIEILVAVTVLAIAVASIFRVFGGSLRTVTNAEGYARASVLAEAKMNEFLMTGAELQPGRESGIFPDNKDYRWESEVEEYFGETDNGNSEEDGINELGRIATYRVSVSVNWDEGSSQRTVELATLKTVVEVE